MTAALSLILISILLSACSTLSPEPRTGKIPNIPVEKRDCNTPLGLIPDGQTATGYLNPVESCGRSCERGVLTCFDGEWDGPYVHATCLSVPDTP